MKKNKSPQINRCSKYSLNIHDANQTGFDKNWANEQLTAGLTYFFSLAPSSALL